MRKFINLLSVAAVALFLVSPAFAQTATTPTGSVDQIVSFIQSVVQVLITLAGTVAVGFFVWGGFGYITSTGHPENLDRSKKNNIVFSSWACGCTWSICVKRNCQSISNNSIWCSLIPLHKL